MEQKIMLPEHLSLCCIMLQQAGFSAYAVGGCVRDLLLGRTPGDWDVTTSALPDEIQLLFPHSISTGTRYGTVTILVNDVKVEVTPFRRDGSYSDRRHPDQVVFGGSLEQDLARRDFTINAIAAGENGSLVDPCGGQKDLERKLIRCVGDPEQRFREDALRLFRAVRFASQLRFKIEESSLSAMKSCASLASHLSVERVSIELGKTLCSPEPQQAELLFQLGLMNDFLDSPAAVPVLDRLPSLPAEPLARWAGLCMSLLSSGAISDVAAFLKKLRQSNRILRCCTSVAELLQKGCPSSALLWREALARYGETVCRTAAQLEGVSTMLDQVLESKPCVRVTDLALTGKEMAALGLSGPKMGLAQQAMLNWVLERPEDNRPDVLTDVLTRMGYLDLS